MTKALRSQAMTSADDNLPVSISAGWGAGSLAMSAMYQATSVLVLRYLVGFLGIPAVLAGLLIGVSKFFDAVIDPLIGIASDRAETAIGRRRPFLLVGGVGSALSFWMLFHVPLYKDFDLRVWMVEAILLLTAAGYSLFNIPYLAMPAEMTRTSQQRTNLTSYRVVAVSIGTITASFVGPRIIDAAGGGLGGHRVMADVLAGIILAASIVCFLMTARAPFRTRGEKTGYSFAAQLRLALENTPFLVLMAIKLVVLFGGAVAGGITPFLFVEIMHQTYTVMGTYFLVTSTVMICSQPLWVAVCRRFGKRPVIFAITPFMMLVSASWLLASAHEPLWAIMARGVLFGFFGGASLLITQAMLPDTIAWDFMRTGLRREGIYAGVYTTIEKVAYALGPAVSGVILGSFGYIQSTGAPVAQPASAITGIYICLIFPIITSAIMLLLFTQYKLNETMLAGAAADRAARPGPVMAPMPAPSP
jgi:GPH family glycoside/pentoside/hexuronide:cation symporter